MDKIKELLLWYSKESFRTINPKKDDSIHYILGLSGEWLNELKIIPRYETSKLVDECGDCLWYLANYSRVEELDFFDYSEERYQDVEQFERSLGELLEIEKKAYAYDGYAKNKDKQQELINICGSYLLNFLPSYVSKESVFKKNIEKLKVRFPDKFESELAINKNKENEEQVFAG